MKERKTDHWKNSKFQRLSKPMRLQSKDSVIICYVMLCYVRFRYVMLSRNVF